MILEGDIADIIAMQVPVQKAAGSFVIAVVTREQNLSRYAWKEHRSPRQKQVLSDIPENKNVKRLCYCILTNAYWYEQKKLPSASKLKPISGLLLKR